MRDHAALSLREFRLCELLRIGRMHRANVDHNPLARPKDSSRTTRSRTCSIRASLAEGGRPFFFIEQCAEREAQSMLQSAPFVLLDVFPLGDPDLERIR